jgi:hypothetical protein
MRRLPRFANVAMIEVGALTTSEYSIAPSVPRKLDIVRSTLRWVLMVLLKPQGAAQSAPIVGVARLGTSCSADEEDVGRDDTTPLVPSVDWWSAAPTQVSSCTSQASSCRGTALIP